MIQDRWKKTADIFAAALQCDAAERSGFVTEACAGDDELRREVEELLRSHEQASRFMEEPALAVAARQDASEAKVSLVGQTVTHYQVLSLLGSGGMGDVYLALDTKLGRQVALKLLPESMTGDAQRARLFTREARAASALNHPHIITVYEIGQWENRYYISMEYVEGVTLRELIHRQRAELGTVLKYLQQVAEGLSKAHAAGIVHRDLKPDNIMITLDGYAKLLDFGLAKLVEQPQRADGVADSSEAATAVLASHSLPGMVMGTVGYMSPEQAQGRVHELDQRSDIFSFGCILFEAATGQKAFAGKDLLDSLHKVVYAPTPQIRDISPHVPADLERIVRRCLAKDREQRYQSIKDVVIELEELQQELKRLPEIMRWAKAETSRHATAVEDRGAAASTAAATAEVAARPTSSAEYLVGEIKRHKTAGMLFAAALAIGSVILIFFLIRQGYIGKRHTASDPPISFEQMKLARLTTSGKVLDASISPDGKYVAYLNLESGGVEGFFGTASIWIKQIATGRNIMIVEPGQFINRGLTFSPDGNYLYYRTQKPGEEGWVFRVSVLGGDAQKVVKNSYSPISFSPDGKRLAFVRNSFPVGGGSSLVIAKADGTDEQIVSTHKLGELFATPRRPTAPVWSPDGRLLVGALGAVGGPYSLLEVQVEGGAERTLGNGHWSSIDTIAWLPDGSALMLTGRDQSSPQKQIWHVAYPSGEAHRVTNDLNDYQGLSLSADSKTMVVVQMARDSDLWLMPNGKPGEAREITSGTGKSDGGAGISWTPDGNLVYTSTASGNRDIWLLDPKKFLQKQLTADARQNWNPVVTPDGRSILFMSDRGDAFGIWRMDIDGSNPKQVIAAPAISFTCSADGKWIVYSALGAKGVPALWKVGMDGGEPVPLNDEYWEELPSISPDSNQVAFQYLERGKPAAIGQLSLEGGAITKIAEPPFRLTGTLRWTPDEKGIAYIDNSAAAGNIWALPLGGGAATQLTDFKSEAIFWFDWSRDGKQLALSRGTQTSDVVLISNFNE